MINKVNAFKNLFAHVFGQLVTIAGAVLLPWICLAKWSAGDFGYWVVISSISQFFVISDFGLSSAISNYIFLDKLTNQDDIFEKFYFGAKILIKRFFAVLLFIFFICLFYGISLFFENNKNYIELSFSLFFLSSAMAMQPVVNLLSGVMRSRGRNDAGVLISNLIRLFELIAIVFSIWFGTDVLQASFVVFAVRSFLTIYILRRIFLKKSKYIYRANAEILPAELNKVGLGFTANMFALNGSLHGMVLVASLGGGALAASFSAARTAARIPSQPIGIVFSSITPELTTLFSRGNYSEFKKIGVYMALGALVFASVAGGFILYFSDWLEKYWLHGKLVLDRNVLLILVFSMIIHVLWQAGAQVLASINLTFNLGLMYLLSTFFGVLGAFVAWKFYGNFGISLSWLILEIIMLFMVFLNIRFLIKK